MSTLKVNTIQNTSGVEMYLASAWVKFTANTGTPVIDDSGNISSITDLGVGDYTLNFETSMASADYGFSGNMGHESNTTAAYSLKMRYAEMAVGSLGIRTVAVTASSDTTADFRDVHVIVFGGR